MNDVIGFAQNENSHARVLDQPIQFAEHPIAMYEIEAKPFAVHIFEPLADVTVHQFTVVDRVEHERIEFNLETGACRCE